MESIKIKVLVRPGKPKTKVIEIMDDDTLRIDIAAPAKQNKANIELLRFLEKHLGGEAEIISGHRSRRKVVAIRNPATVNWKEKLVTRK